MTCCAGSACSAKVRVLVGPEIAGELLDLARSAKAAGLGGAGMRYGPDTEHALDELHRVSAALADFDPMRQLPGRHVALAFWLNLYNTMVIDGALTSRVRRSVTEVPRFFRRVAYDIGGRRYNPDLIEHGVLRENRGHPLRIAVPQIMPWDPRRALVLRPMDVRAHFALNCGAVSCPPIRHYTAENIDEELELAARSFMAGGGVGIDARTGGVLLSRIFLWYARDFGWTRRRQLRAALQYVDTAQRTVLEAAAENGVRYAEYDWGFA